MLRWASRCLPGFSIISLVVVIFLAFSGRVTLPLCNGFFPPAPPLAPNSPTTDTPPSPLNVAQRVFMIYSIIVHLNMLGFTMRLCWALVRVIKETKLALQRRASTFTRTSHASLKSNRAHYAYSPAVQLRKYPDTSVVILDEMEDEEVVHAIILPNYCEDMDTLQTTLRVLACHPRARSQYEVYLAMEQKEAASVEKAALLMSLFKKSFLCVRSTFHPAGLRGEIAGKSSNVAFAARRIVQAHRADVDSNFSNVIITVMDADTHLSQDYFNEIRRLHYAHIAEAERSFYSCPIIFDRNSHETPIMVRCADLLWGFAGISTMYPGTRIAVPTSVYSLPLTLAKKVGGWDSDPTAIGEDMHMLLKCYFETAGDLISRVVYIPASQCNVSGDDTTRQGWRRTVDTCMARYRQALRHMWGALDTGFATRKTVSSLFCFFFFSSYYNNNSNKSRRSLFLFLLRPKQWGILHLLWEAHFLPIHSTMVVLFSTAYTFYTPANAMNPELGWTFWFTRYIRHMSFIWMNICLCLYERWHAMCLNSRMNDMMHAKLPDTGFSQRKWWRMQYLLERLCFPVSGTVFGAIPTLHAVFSHFWTDRLVYRVSKKPSFAGMV